MYNTKRNIIVGVVYRVPNSNLEIFNTEFTDLLKHLTQENKRVYITGDYNLDLLKYEKHRPTSDFIETLYSHNFMHMVNKPTRVTQHSATLIDNIFTNEFCDDLKHHQGIFYTDLSNHFPIFHINQHLNPQYETDNYILKRIMHPTNIADFVTECNSMDWASIVCLNDAQLAYTSFHDTFSKIYNRHFPLKRFKFSYRNRKPWLTNELKMLIKQKNKMFIKQKKYQTDNNINEYKLFRNKLNKTLHNAERNHYHNLLEEHKSDLKKSWNILKTVINKKVHKKNPAYFRYNNSILKDKEVIAERFNDFFVNVGPQLARKIQTCNKSPLDYMHNKVMDSFYISPSTEDEVSKTILNLKNSSAGWDGFHASAIKKVSTSIAVPIMHICNLSFLTGVFPFELKIANVLPLFKSGDDTIFTNYRPVSVLPLISKIIERLMYNRLLNFINKHNLLYAYQFGFRQKYSTYMALLTLVDKISTALDEGDKVIGIFLDFSKAFDTVDHSILLSKLEFYGIRGISLSWFESYLSGREQFVTYSEVSSKKAKITCGVPQGSILGPLLFLLYINDLASVVPVAFALLFADDTNLFYRGKYITELVDTVNRELGYISKWLNANKLSLNIDKTNYIIFIRSNKQMNDLNVLIKGIPIQRVFTTKFLGVLLDSHLNWKDQLTYIGSKLSKCCGILLKARRYLQKKSLINLY